MFQLNLLSLSENYGKGVQKTTEKLLKENMYDFVGTDAHHFNHLDGLKKISTKKNLIKLEDGPCLCGHRRHVSRIKSAGDIQRRQIIDGISRLNIQSKSSLAGQFQSRRAV